MSISSKSIQPLIYEEYAGHLHGNQRYIGLLAGSLNSSLTVLLPFRAGLAKSLEENASTHVVLSLPLWKRPIAVARHILQCRPDVLLVNNERSLLIAAIGALLAGVPIIWYVKNFRSSFLVDLICFFFAARVLTIAPQCIQRKGWVAKIFSRKVCHLPIGIPLEHFLTISEAEPQRYALNVLLLGAITPAKGIRTAVDAVRIARKDNVSLKLRIAGATPKGQEKFAEDIYRETDGLPIEWLGWKADVASLIKQADVVILPSSSEGVPRSLVEAMAAARPVIASRVGGIPSIVEHGKNGLLIDVGDAAGLASALVEMAGKPEMMRTLGYEARAYAKAHHNFSNHLESLKAHLAEVAEVART